MSLQSQVAEIRDKVDALSSRERVIIAVTVIAVIFGIYNQFVLDPFLKHRKELQQQMAAIGPEMEVMQQSMESLIKRQASDPNISLRNTVKKKNKKVKELEGIIENETKRLIDPQKMPKILGYLLSRQSALKINSVKSSSGEPIYLDADRKKPSGLFKHDLTMSLEGTYYQVQSYLKNVEEMAEQVYWDEMTFESKKYPVGVLVLNVHTLSTSKELIGVY